MFKFASVVMFCVVGTIVDAPIYYWIAVASYFILYIRDNFFNK